ncbi:DUF4189 domain-containing protein (plasmid) [Rhizobium sp. NIBRBAC000502774]|nr:DUF4189 domain-containing protein [Rhizobium sp. NIBRBAC000502774]
MVMGAIGYHQTSATAKTGFDRAEVDARKVRGVSPSQLFSHLRSRRADHPSKRNTAMNKAVPFALIAALCAMSGGSSAPAQTACPVGTTPGSATCGPTPGGETPTPPATPAGEWMDRFGAVAADMSTSGNIGVAANRLSREDAEDEAIAKCRSLGSVKCDIVLHYSNQCVAIVSPSVNGVERGGYPVTRPGKTVAAAIGKAMPDCRKANDTRECMPIYSACSLPVFRKY